MTDISPSLDMELIDLDLSAPPGKPVALQPDRPSDIVSLPRARHSPPDATGFDYSGVSKSIAKEAEATARRIRDRLRANTIETGNELLNIKQKLGHGKFGKWLEFHFGWKERTAQNYMNSATAFGATPQVVDALPPSTVYKLAAKSTPETLRQAVIDEINRGELPNAKNLEKRIIEVKAKARIEAKSDDSVPSAKLTNAESQIKPEAGGEAGAVTIDPQEERRHEAQFHEASARKLTELLKKSLGAHFEMVRDMILKTDYAILKRALAEASA